MGASLTGAGASSFTTTSFSAASCLADATLLLEGLFEVASESIELNCSGSLGGDFLTFVSGVLGVVGLAGSCADDALDDFDTDDFFETVESERFNFEDLFAPISSAPLGSDNLLF